LSAARSVFFPPKQPYIYGIKIALPRDNLNLSRGSDRLGSAAERDATEYSDDVATDRPTSPPTSTAAVPIGRAIANTRLYVLDCLRPGDLCPARGQRRAEIALPRA
jgi:non-ribosomal peptide synthetase component F